MAHFNSNSPIARMDVLGKRISTRESSFVQASARGEAQRSKWCWSTEGKKLSVSASVRFVLPLGGGVGVIVAFGLDGWGGGGCSDDYCYDDDHANDILIHYGIATTTTEKGDEQDVDNNKRL